MTRTVISGGQVFDSLSGTASIADIVVDGNRIVAVGTGLDADESIDATGHAVYPGFIDSHVHIDVAAAAGAACAQLVVAADELAAVLADALADDRQLLLGQRLVEQHAR